MSKLDSLQNEYDELQRRCGSFDNETIKLLREGEERRRQFIADRKKLRQELIDRKGRVHEQLQSEKTREEAETMAAKLIAEDAPLTKMPTITIPQPGDPYPHVSVEAAEEQPAEEKPPEEKPAEQKPAETPAAEHVDEKVEAPKAPQHKGRGRR